MSESLESILNAWTERKPRGGPSQELDDYAPSQQPLPSMPPDQIVNNMRAMGQGMGMGATAVKPASMLPAAVREAIEKYEASRKPS